MPLEIVRNDITKMKVDAIVDPANRFLIGSGSASCAIHKAAGRGLSAECRKLRGCKPGQAKITGGYNLPAKYVIHTVGPIYRGGNRGEKEILESSYRESLALAKEYECETVAFPLISSGVHGYPKDQALRVAIDVIGEFLLENDITVYIVVFDKASYMISEKLFSDITEYIDDVYAEARNEYILKRSYSASSVSSDLVENSCEVSCGIARSIERSERLECADKSLAEVISEEHRMFERSLERKRLQRREVTEERQKNETRTFLEELTLEAKLRKIDESFSQMLLRKIDEKGMTDAECYKKANIDRKLFSKIRGDAMYKPSKTTVIAFAIALELPLSETEEMLRKAGFALSHSNKFDIIIEYFITRGNYNVFEINEALFAFDQSLLGA